jgi:hypothetical protein
MECHLLNLNVNYWFLVHRKKCDLSEPQLKKLGAIQFNQRVYVLAADHLLRVLLLCEGSEARWVCK